MGTVVNKKTVAHHGNRIAYPEHKMREAYKNYGVPLEM